MDNYLSNGARKSTNVFDEEIDDEEFLRHPRAGNAGYALPNQNNRPVSQHMTGQQRDLDQQRQELAIRRQEIEERTLASSERGLGLLYESEKVGLATAEELTRQKEQLLLTEQRLDDINSTLRNSEKHIQGIKSVFGSIRNYFSGRSPAATLPGGGVSPNTTASNITPSKSSPQIGNSRFNSSAMADLQQSEGYQDNHPALRNRPGFVQRPVDVDAALDKNLDDMASGLARLKGLAQGLNEELHEHNDLLDRVNTKTEDVKFKVDRQNKDMSRILGKK